jgi:hypothetical protein
MLDEFRRYCSLQRDQAPLASLLVYLKRMGGWVQLNQVWRDLGPSGGGPFWNQTTLINKLDKLERLEIISIDRRLLPSPRAESKKKTNTFYRLNLASPVVPHIFSMLSISSDGDKFSSELVERPLEKLSEAALRSDKGDHSAKRELAVALDLISEVFSISGPDAKEMVRQRMRIRGLIPGEPKDLDEEELESISDQIQKKARKKAKSREGVKGAKDSSEDRTSSVTKVGAKGRIRRRSKKSQKGEPEVDIQAEDIKAE